MEAPVARVAVAAATYWIDRPYSYRVPEELRALALPGARVTVPFGRGNRRSEGVILALSEPAEGEKLKSLEAVPDKEPILTAEQIKLALWMRERFFCTVFDAVKAMLPAGLWYKLEADYSLAPGMTEAEALSAARPGAEADILRAVLDLGGSAAESALFRALPGAEVPAALSRLVKKGILAAGGRETRRVRDKTVSTASLAVSAAEAWEFAAAKRRSAPSQAAILELLCVIGSAPVPEIRSFTGASATAMKALAAKGLVEISQREVFRRPDFRAGESKPLPELNGEQEAAFRGILARADGGEASAALLFGVTGSGKTAVYVRLISEMLKRGKGSILLVPEIALTPQMLRTFSSYFGDEIAVLHSSLSTAERYDEWKRVRSGAARVVIGTRSAVFAPVKDLGLIAIDEEQERTYKSENSPRYHAREVAKYLCYRAGALLLLGSATPDVCSRYNAESGRYGYWALPTRYNRGEMPAVMIADMKKELREGNGGSISSVLRRELEKNIASGEQSILFLNRRGANKLITCVDCGFTYKCPRCSVSLTWHKTGDRLRCHYCGYSRRVDDSCPDCGGHLTYLGAGTQRIVDELLELFPGTELLRMDADTVGPAGGHEALLERFRRERIPIMVGTQMVTKGLNFENVTLVGVLSADESMYSGDYRAGERTFSLITQVIGRSGRFARPGRAVIQTFTPQNQTVLQAASQDYESFYRSEIELRRIQGSPPFSELIAFTSSGAEEAAVLACCADVRARLAAALRGAEGARILGPAPLPVVRVNNRYRYRVILSCRAEKSIRQLAAAVVTEVNTDKKHRGVSTFADIDPLE